MTGRYLDHAFSLSAVESRTTGIGRSINPPVEDLPTATAATNGAAVHSSPTTEAADQGKNSQKSHIANDQATKPQGKILPFSRFSARV